MGHPEQQRQDRMRLPESLGHLEQLMHRIGDGQEGPITRRLRETLCAIHYGNSEHHPEWIHVVPERDWVSRTG